MIVIATLVVSAKSYFRKDDPLVAAYELCLDKRAEEAHVINACSEVLQVVRLSDETRSSLLKNRANAYRKIDKFDQAFADIDQVLALKPDDANAFQWRSQLFLDLEDFERAEIEYQKARSLAPKDTELVNWWFRWMSGEDRQEKVLAACEQLTLADPRHNAGLSCSVKPLLKLGRIDEAIRVLVRIAKTDTDKEKAGANYFLGRIYLHLDFSKAETLAAFEKWNEMELEESKPLSALFLAATYLKFGDEEVGARHISDVVQHLSQELPDGWSTLKGRVARSFEPFVYRGAIEHYYAGLAYSMIREYDRAKHEYDLFIQDGGSNAKSLLVQIMVEKGYVPSAEEANTAQRVFERGLERYMAHNGRHFSFDALID
ncbi:tetratricopeptide repeat protein [Aliiroseovarius sp. 2305UL8-7]|uniref:tetratricopeptide repeat protein n=1 Tax=Aliiroseovarius conchicola TaxID=3121637 RepID=UPI0035279E1B